MAKRKLRILVRSPNWLGDAIMALPFLENVRLFYPHAYIAIWCKPHLVDVFKAYAGIDEIIIYPRKLKDLWNISLRLKKRFDVCFLLPNSFSSAFSAFLSGVPERIGYLTDGRRILLTRGVKPKRGLHQVDYYLNLLSNLGFKPHSCTPTLNILPEGNTEKARLKKRFKWKDVPIIFIPGAAYGLAKCWPAEKFAKLAEKFKSIGKAILILGNKKEKSIARKIIQSVSDASHIIDLTGLTSLAGAMAIVSEASIVVTNDSGLMHVIAALGCPQIAIFGPTDPKHTCPYGNTTEIIYHPVPCAPCKHRICPKDHACMEAVKVEEVYEKAINKAILC